ncbi:MAG: hypothetical protein ACHQDY_04150 [Solirubrobacterales bacterium]
MVDRKKTALNVAIVLLIAAAVYFLPSGGRIANTFAAVLSVAFTAGLAYMAARLYRERRVDLYGLGDRHRALLYGALAVGVFAVAAKERMWLTGFGEFVWFVLVGLVVYTLIAVYRFARTY